MDTFAAEILTNPSTITLDWETQAVESNFLLLTIDFLNGEPIFRRTQLLFDRLRQRVAMKKLASAAAQLRQRTLFVLFSRSQANPKRALRTRKRNDLRPQEDRRVGAHSDEELAAAARRNFEMSTSTTGVEQRSVANNGDRSACRARERRARVFQSTSSGLPGRNGSNCLSSKRAPLLHQFQGM